MHRSPFPEVVFALHARFSQRLRRRRHACSSAERLISLRRLFDFRRVSQHCKPRDSTHLANCPEFLSQSLKSTTGTACSNRDLPMHLFLLVEASNLRLSNSGLIQNGSDEADRAPHTTTFLSRSNRAFRMSSGNRNSTKPGLHERRRTVLRVIWPVRHFCVSQVGHVALRRNYRLGKHTRRQTFAGGSSQTENRQRSARKTN